MTAVLRVVLGFWLVAWFINAPGEPGFIDNFEDAVLHPIHYAAFPSVLTHPGFAYAVYVSPSVCVSALFWDDVRLWRGAGLVTLGASLVMCLHIETCNDATFVTAWWVSLWLNWMVHNRHRRGRRVAVLARGLAHAIVGLIFLGGLVGKLTGQFHDGEAFYGLYFQHGQDFPYDVLREGRSRAAYRELATWFSRLAISSEAMLVASPFLPTRFVLPFYVAAMVVMMTFRNYNLFSVLGAPLGLLIAAELLQRRARGSAT